MVRSIHLRSFASLAQLACIGLASIVSMGCSGAAVTPASAPPEPAPTSVKELHSSPTAEAPPVEEPRGDLPAKCENEAMCALPTAFAERVCKGVYPEVALYLFGPSTPWKRAYLRRSFKAWHVGGHGELRELRTGEEVIIATVARDGNGMQIGGRAFDVLRWDGTCVSLMEDEISFTKPGAAVPANISWKNLDRPFQAALAAEKQIDMLHTNESKTCEGAAAEQEPGKSKCEIAHRQLSLAIAQWIGRGKAALPPLASIP